MSARCFLLESVSLSKVYDGSRVPALTQVTLTVERGEVFTLLGRNGAGKTTFLRIAATQLLPTEGEINVLGFDAVAEATRIRGKMAAVLQVDYLPGIASAGLFYSSPAPLILVPLLIHLGLPPGSLPLALLASGALWLFSAAIGYLFSTYMPNVRNGWQAAVLLSVVVGILPPPSTRPRFFPRTSCFSHMLHPQPMPHSYFETS